MSTESLPNSSKIDCEKIYRFVMTIINTSVSMKLEQRITIIDKAEIEFLHFPKEDVLFSASDKENREIQLKKALTVGNLNHFKVKIFFEDIGGIKNVDTTIWGLTHTSVILKKGVVIPIARINRIEFI